MLASTRTAFSSLAISCSLAVYRLKQDGRRFSRWPDVATLVN
ncbi:hypothetical protein [Aeromonas enteropelogenes]|nr:hypothetical protein [Aeromonas enteropelogenes]